MTTAIKKDMAERSAELARHQHLYHVDDDPVISDPEYDILIRELAALEAKYPKYKVKNSPTDSVGGKPVDASKEIKHLIPMLSLGNSLNEEQALVFFAGVAAELKLPLAKVEVKPELKYDGLSTAAVYLFGHLKQGATRGDGETGEDITPNLREVNNVPHYIDALKDVERFEVRGEVLMLRSSFKSLNESQALVGDKIFSNPRNAAAGSLRNSDPAITKHRALHFYAYSLGKCSDSIYPVVAGGHSPDPFGVETQNALLLKFKELGFTIMEDPLNDVITADAVAEHFQKAMVLRPNLPFEIDGVVYKLNKLTHQEQLGWKSRTPNWATAYKFPADTAETILEAIEIQVGRTGAQAPVARLKAVKCGGVEVTNATLHNINEITRKDLRVGDTVLIMRNGDVIPGVSHAILAKRPAGATTYVMPTTCPSCGGATHKEDNGAITYCLAGLACPAQRLGAISHYVSRKAMDIDGIGDSTIQTLLEHGLVKTMSDLYKLKKEDILGLPGFGESSAELLVNGVHLVKKPELRRFIYALGMPNTGEGTSKRLAEHFCSFEALMQADIPALVAIADIGHTTANSIYGYLHDAVTGAEACELAKILEPQDLVKVDTSAMKLGGKTFLVTGTLSVKRDVIHKLVEENGGVISGSINKDLNFLVVGADAGSKLEKAEKLNTSGKAKITILDEQAFRELIA